MTVTISLPTDQERRLTERANAGGVSVEQYLQQLIDLDLQKSSAAPNGSAGTNDEWTDAKNHRRCELIDKKIDHSLTDEEARELQGLQSELARHQERVAPLPIEHARQLHQQLLNLAIAAEAGKKE